MDLKEVQVIVQKEADEELLNKADLCERILRCDTETADIYYINQPNFPFVMQGKRKKYPKKLVEKWIHDQVRYQ